MAEIIRFEDFTTLAGDSYIKSDNNVVMGGDGVVIFKNPYKDRVITFTKHKLGWFGDWADGAGVTYDLKPGQETKFTGDAYGYTMFSAPAANTIAAGPDDTTTDVPLPFMTDLEGWWKSTVEPIGWALAIIIVIVVIAAILLWLNGMFSPVAMASRAS